MKNRVCHIFSPLHIMSPIIRIRCCTNNKAIRTITTHILVAYDHVFFLLMRFCK